MAARRPSSPWPGGMLMSATSRSGRWARPLRRRSSASPASATTSKPAAVSTRAMPSRRSTSSSPTATRRGAIIGYEPTGAGPGWLLGGEPVSRAAPVASSDLETNACAPTRRACAEEPSAACTEVTTTARAPRQGGQLAGELETVAVGQLDVDQRAVGLHPRGRRAGLGDRARLGDDHQAAGREHESRQPAERRVVIHHQDGSGRSDDDHSRRAGRGYGEPDIPSRARQAASRRRAAFRRPSAAVRSSLALQSSDERNGMSALPSPALDDVVPNHGALHELPASSGVTVRPADR